MDNTDCPTKNEGLCSTTHRPTIHDEAFHGVLGAIVMKVSPNSEVDKACLLSHLIVYAGAAIGPCVKLNLGGVLHGLQLFMIVVGNSGNGKKGLAEKLASRVIKLASDNQFGIIRKSGLVSGQGLIEHLKEFDGGVAVRSGGETKHEALPTPVLVVETEFAKTLKAGKVEGSNLSHNIRQAFDGDKLEQMGRDKHGNAISVERYCMSIIAHITPTEHEKEHNAVDRHNGFLNRFLFTYSHRERLLPRGLDPLEVVDLSVEVGQLREHIEAARSVSSIDRSEVAEKLWEEYYIELDGLAGGPMGEMFVRGPVHVMKVAAIFALIDASEKIEAVHLKAAKAIFDYSVDSVHWQFSKSLLAKKILAALEKAPNGISKSGITKSVLNRNYKASQIDPVMAELQRQGLIVSRAHEKAELWFLSKFKGVDI